jgi:hypothetical protein
MFSGVWIGVGFQLEPQLTFRYTVVNVKPRFIAVSLSTTPFWKLVAKNRFRCSTHALL